MPVEKYYHISGDNIECRPDSVGHWVKRETYEKIESELAEVKAQNENISAWMDENHELKAKLAEALKQTEEYKETIIELTESSVKDDQIIYLQKQLLELTRKYYETREPKHICRCNSRSRTNTE